jgi:CDP-diacylglycerol--serine O-phosphatidyltransferase
MMRGDHTGARKKERASTTLRRGVHLIPSLFTTANILFGFLSVLLATSGKLETAALLIGLAALLDALDGRVARMTGTTSDFGREFDSLADVISFGVAPAVLAWRWALEGFGRLGWAAAFIFVICSAVRLARYNIQAGPSDRRWFVGLPTPPAACTIAACVFLNPRPLDDQVLQVMGLLLVITLSGLMISKIRYRSFKDLDLRARRPYVWVVPVAVVFALIAAHPQLFLLISAFVYVLSGFLTRRGVPARAGVLQDPAQASGPAGPEHGR